VVWFNLLQKQYPGKLQAVSCKLPAFKPVKEKKHQQVKSLAAGSL
jgi:hypothetical protein